MFDPSVPVVIAGSLASDVAGLLAIRAAALGHRRNSNIRSVNNMLKRIDEASGK